MKKPPSPFIPADYEPADLAAMYALRRGEASPEQQMRALDWIIDRAACFHETTFFPDSDRLTSFHEGRRYVGSLIRKLIVLNPAALTKD